MSQQRGRLEEFEDKFLQDALKSPKTTIIDGLLSAVGVTKPGQVKRIVGAFEPATSFEDLVTGIFDKRLPELKETVKDINDVTRHRARLMEIERILGVR